MNPETLNWQEVVSGWSFTCGGEAPPDGLAASVVPSVLKSSDGLFEITTVSFGFSGTAPYHQQKFTAEFSFSISATANFYEISVSSDDTATVKLGGVDFVSSRLFKSGVASSSYADEASALPKISGTFETIGGPYSLSVTIALKRFIGAEWVLSEEWTESDPYEIKTATLSFSGSAHADTLGFSWKSALCNIDGGNWVEISVEADDEATVSAGEYSVTATANKSATFSSDWIETAPTAFPLSVSYRNVGGSYRLSVTITVKRSLRRLMLGFLYTPPAEDEEGVQDFSFPISLRRIIGVGESICVYSLKRNTLDPLGEITKVRLKYPQGEKFISGEGNELCIDGINFIQEGSTLISANFTDGEIIKEKIDVLFPREQKGKEIALREYLLKEDGRAFTQEELTSQDPEVQEMVAEARSLRPGEIRTYQVKLVEPEGVSFSGIEIWECTGTCEVSGIFADASYFLESWRIHMPTAGLLPIHPSYNFWEDDVGLALHKLPDNYEDFPIGAVLGTMIWTIPTRWNVYSTYLTDPMRKDRVSALEASNDDREFLGEFSFKSIQTMVCLRTATGIKVVVSKKHLESGGNV